jgi:hypothetical protein
MKRRRGICYRWQIQLKKFGSGGQPSRIVLQMYLQVKRSSDVLQATSSAKIIRKNMAKIMHTIHTETCTLASIHTLANLQLQRVSNKRLYASIHAEERAFSFQKKKELAASSNHKSKPGNYTYYIYYQEPKLAHVPAG